MIAYTATAVGIANSIFFFLTINEPKLSAGILKKYFIHTL